mmetsp:Transcript_5790/g.10100  ORF Transcript_5790/g.10100 Transcript_5790/m.10100 type:complete len:95 (-) Transcript_5790:1063-1347(-)
MLTASTFIRNASVVCNRLNRACLRSISSSLLAIERTSNEDRFKNRPAKEDLTFGTTMSDHMLTIEWDQGWKAPKIVPYGHLHLCPAASSLQYGE